MSEPRVLAFDDIDSTNTEAKRQVEAGEVGPLWITARRQHQGRGRRGRAWDTSDGNLAATYLFSTAMPAGEAAQVSFVAALAVADLAGAFVGAGKVSLKWPNDPMIEGMKTSGILVESGALGPGRLWLAVGCGVNLAHAPTGLERPATAFAQHMTTAPPTPEVAAGVLIKAFETWRSLWETQGFGPIAQAWTTRAHGLGQRCEARLANETIEGIAEGLDLDGALRLRLADGQVRRITAGDVFF